VNVSGHRMKLPALALVAGLAACSLAPEYKVPAVDQAPATYKENGDWKLAQPADEQPRGEWWNIFQDAQLNALEAQVGEANQNIKAAFARLQQARAATRVSRAGYFPTINAGPTLTRSRASSNGPHFVPGKPNVGNDLVLSADFSYEVDAWGRVGNAVTSSRAAEQAGIADLAAVDLATHAELASDYFSLRGADRQSELLDHAVADYAKALQLTQNRYNGGAASMSDVAQAQAQLETAKTQAADVRLQRAQLEHAIAVLTGKPASGFHIDATPLTADMQPPAINPGLPSALLERRPDVAAAERHMAAANAQIGIARAAYFPVFSLSAMAGFESTSAPSWIEAPSHLWSLGASALLTVFDGGRRSALTDQARSAYDETVANYRGSVLNAYREVEDSLAALHLLEQENTSESAAVAATQKALQQANFRYKGGITTYLEVVVAENAALQAQLSAANIQTRRMNASVLLVKAIGGGWSVDMADRTETDNVKPESK
jgi:NodT family efflux transporter outer membrane factor (OMF) lipoprotein